MKELVGHCKRCQKEIYCLDGFFNGIKLNDGQLLCFACEEKQEEEV
ncbi:hypothetical protein JOC86_001699 [Bacillus pakistanensis]|uniref:Uncharacterized protein n=1 Tax=Rossellomorea pakistanensis TaxID=992288 RepID=A0ABS2NBB8_9BACI|nr:hypothetical protein [Bacillus pakistanensis]MBM7585157.1 hypothetical protein [Bacillus pakistanensis]